MLNLEEAGLAHRSDLMTVSYGHGRQGLEATLDLLCATISLSYPPSPYDPLCMGYLTTEGSPDSRRAAAFLTDGRDVFDWRIGSFALLLPNGIECELSDRGTGSLQRVYDHLKVQALRALSAAYEMRAGAARAAAHPVTGKV